MARTISAGSTERVVPRGTTQTVKIRVREGTGASLTRATNVPPSSGERVEPGEEVHVSPSLDTELHLHAIDEDVEFERSFGEELDAEELVEESIEIRATETTDSALWHPTDLADEFDVAAPGADTDILGSDLTPRNAPSIFRVTLVLAAASVFNAQIQQGSTTKTAQFNSGSALGATELHVFDFEVREADSINFQVETNVAVDVLRVSELPAGAP